MHGRHSWHGCQCDLALFGCGGGGGGWGGSSVLPLVWIWLYVPPALSKGPKGRVLSFTKEEHPPTGCPRLGRRYRTHNIFLQAHLLSTHHLALA